MLLFHLLNWGDVLQRRHLLQKVVLHFLVFYINLKQHEIVNSEY